jgi:hypothetical protein
MDLPSTWARSNASHLSCLGWSFAVLRLRGRCDYDGGVGWPAVAVSLPVVGSLDGEVTHLPFDHPRVAAVSTLDIDFGGNLVQETSVVIVMTGEGEKCPVSISWTG